MTRFLTLFKVLLINSFGTSAFRAKASKNRLEYFKALGIAALIAVGLGPSLYLYCRIIIQAYELMSPLGQAGSILSLGIVMVSVMIFFFGIFYVINIFYFASDAQSLLALPLRAWQVLGARFCVVLLYEYLTALPFLWPPLLIYGILSQASPIYYLYAVIGFLFVPLLPLGLATLPTVVLMRFANLGHHKDLFKILGGLFIIALAIGYQFIFQNSGPQLVDPQSLQNLLTDRNGLINLISRFFPSSRYLSLALVNYSTIDGLINLFIFAALSILTVALAWVLGEKMYFQGLIGSSEMNAKRKKIKQSDYKKIARRSSPLFSYLKKELYLLIRTPSYFINCVLTNVLVPVIVLIPLLLQSRNQAGPMPWLILVSNQAGQKIILAAMVGLVAFLASSNGITATSLSREGKEFYISKYIPLATKQKLLAKLLSGYIFGLIGAVLLIIAGNIILPMKTSLNATIIIVSLVSIVPILEAGLLIDLFNPKLDWENEQKAVKQNINVVFSMIFAILLCSAIIYIEIKFIDSLKLAAAFMLTCFGLAAALLYYFLMRKGIEQYDKLEG